MVPFGTFLTNLIILFLSSFTKPPVSTRDLKKTLVDQIRLRP